VVLSSLIALSSLIWFSGVTRERRAITTEVQGLMSEYAGLANNWRLRGGQGDFVRYKSEVEVLKDRALITPQKLEDLRLMQLRRSYGSHLKIFLRKYTIMAADITAAGAELKRRLVQAGIRTAADITPQSLAGKSFVRPEISAQLLEWRDRMEAQYWASTHHALTSEQQKEIADHLKREHLEIYKKLQTAEKELKSLSEDTIQSQENIQGRVAELSARLKLLGPDVAACEKTSGPIRLS
jgi:DNA-binding helix-hairpin-helix protein with protein kinase domain